MHAARDFDPAGVRSRGGHYINGQFVTDVGHGGRGDIEVRRPSDHQPYGQIPDAGPEGVDQAVRTAQAALKASGWGTRFAPNYSLLREASTTHNISQGAQFGKRCRATVLH